ncbi:MAG TPA: flagellar basal body rod protein FlgC [Fimbriimonadaceae bacterium]|jgi:flagellar basal-body rod protein FlgC
MSSLNDAMRISASGLSTERFRLDVISSNIANANSVGVNGQDPYRRRDVSVIGGPDGVKIGGVVEDQSPFRVVHEPGNPNADAQGNVSYSNVEPVQEMVNMMGASRAYEANVAAFNSAKGMINSALTIGKV